MISRSFKKSEELARLLDETVGGSLGSKLLALAYREAAQRVRNLHGFRRHDRLLAREFDETARRAETSTQPCRTCRKPVEAARRAYAVPTCFACLPPPKLQRVSGREPDATSDAISRRIALENLVAGAVAVREDFNAFLEAQPTAPLNEHQRRELSRLRTSISALEVRREYVAKDLADEEPTA